MDEIEDLIMSFMMHFIESVMIEYVSSQSFCETRSVITRLIRKCMVDGEVAYTFAHLVLRTPMHATTRIRTAF